MWTGCLSEPVTSVAVRQSRRNHLLSIRVSLNKNSVVFLISSGVHFSTPETKTTTGERDPFLPVSLAPGRTNRKRCPRSRIEGRT